VVTLAQALLQPFFMLPQPFFMLLQPFFMPPQSFDKLLAGAGFDKNIWSAKVIQTTLPVIERSRNVYVSLPSFSAESAEGRLNPIFS